MRSAAASQHYPIFGRSDLLIALFGSAVMALAGAGVASWFGHSPGASGFATHVQTVSPAGEASR